MQHPLSSRLSAALDSLRRHISQNDLERRLGLSVGYLARVKHLQPSRPLVALLRLLAWLPQGYALAKDGRDLLLRALDLIAD